MRLRASGLRIVYAPLITLIHYESKTRGFDFLTPEKQRRAEYERSTLLRRTGGEAWESDEYRHPALSAWANEKGALK
jgi:GT2 family glycosyltransferase